jgi:hypothetical protein
MAARQFSAYKGLLLTRRPSTIFRVRSAFRREENINAKYFGLRKQKL